MKYLTSSILALAGMAILAPAAKAVTYTNGDILVGFRSTASDYDYLVDLGNYTQFQAGGAFATNNPVVVASGSAFTSDLSGAGLSTGTFGVFGTISNGPGSFYAVFGTEQESAPGMQTAGQMPPSLGGFNTPNSALATQGSQFNKGADTINTPPSQTLGTYAQSVIQHVTADSNPNVAPNNYSSYLQPANAFGYFTTPYEGAYDITSSSGGDVVDLWQDQRSHSSPVLLGEFQVVNGQLLFDSANDTVATFPLTAVPEPASMLFGLVMVGACAVRRFRTVAMA